MPEDVVENVLRQIRVARRERLLLDECRDWRIFHQCADAREAVYECLHVFRALFRLEMHFLNVQGVLRMGPREPDETPRRWMRLEDDRRERVWVIHDLLREP